MVVIVVIGFGGNFELGVGIGRKFFVFWVFAGLACGFAAL